jgi:hypothetical protein
MNIFRGVRNWRLAILRYAFGILPRDKIISPGRILDEVIGIFAMTILCSSDTHERILTAYALGRPFPL